MQNRKFTDITPNIAYDQILQIQADNTERMVFYVQVKCPYCEMCCRHNLDKTIGYFMTEKHVIGKALKEGLSVIKCVFCQQNFVAKLEVSFENTDNKTAAIYSVDCRKIEGI